MMLFHPTHDFINDTQNSISPYFKQHWALRADNNSYLNIAFNFIAFRSLAASTSAVRCRFNFEPEQCRTSTANGIVNRFDATVRIQSKTYGVRLPIEGGNLCQCWLLGRARDWFTVASRVLPPNAITIKINVECKSKHIRVCAIRERYTTNCETRTIK